MRRMLFAFGLVGSVVACGTSASSSSSSAEADLTMADLPVQLPTSPTEYSFDQVLDHEAPTTDTFKQRYWFSPGFSTGPTSPTLLYICGETDKCSGGYAANMGDTARGLGASVLVVEHRYYGKSLPFAKPKPADMKYLTIHNALEDLAAIQKSVAREKNLQGKLIAVGGSYPGMLAAFYRLKHPELAAGAWASSAPIEVVKSFPEYDARAARTLGATCSMLVRQAQADVVRRFADPVAKATLVRRMWATATDTQITDMIDASWVTGWIGSSGASGAQYGSGKTLCDALAQHETDPLEGFLNFYKRPLFADALDDAGAPAASAEPIVGPDGLETPAIPTFHLHPSPDNSSAEDDFYQPIDAWQYQVCREVGFYQVHNADRTQSIFTDDVDEAAFDADCQDTFGITPDIAGTRKTYLDPILAGEATNILFTNGTEDPWSTLSPVDPSSPPPGTDVFVLQGGSHCSDLRNLTKTSAPAIFELHVKLNALAKTWLGL